MIFVDDGSSDGTLDALRAASASNPHVRYLSLSRNFGHQIALKAGLDHATGACVISMDCDMQHPPELLPALVAKWREGYDVVYTVRHDDRRLPLLKRATSSLFYRLMNMLSETRVEPGAADFRLLDRKVVEALRPIGERSLFLRGLVPWLGFSQVGIPYEPAPRKAGQSKYSFVRMLRFAVDGVSSFSAKPLQWSSMGGCAVSALAGLYAVYSVLMHLFTDNTATGWTSLMVALLFLGGLNLMAIGILGTYLGKLFLDSKPRPIYVIKETDEDEIPVAGA